ncbi:hypothetical protein JVT61DRAFT_7450 [Boletus reticuloceps]|uniref:Zn(2)-C6 fungal-type domain-containing protein n=1 Tax=Boletus reticuloceps TaxID=495285 RepID=A0A8I2YIJ2_9AGAM|nr:hypothetical protein JVT61DRAFT_7450 [Boletus reticuloceps]
MRECQPFVDKWTAEVIDRNRQVEEMVREKREHEEGRGPQDMGKSAPQEREMQEEDASGKTDPALGKEGGGGKALSVPPTTDTTTSEAGSGTSNRSHLSARVSLRPKCSRLIVEDEEDEDEGDSRPVKKATGGPPVVTYKTPCGSCAQKSKTCRGPEGRTCFHCARLKSKCSKLAGQPQKALNVVESDGVLDRKGKGKAPIGVEETIVLSSGEDEKTPQKVPPSRKESQARVSNELHETGVRVVKGLEGKIRLKQLQLKAKEARMAEMEMEVVSEMVELDKIKRALGL